MKNSSQRKQPSAYPIWYEFRQELSKHLGYVPLNSQWLEIKPKAPLPWDDLDMKAALSSVTSLDEQKTTQELRWEKRRRTGCEQWPDCHRRMRHVVL